MVACVCMAINKVISLKSMKNSKKDRKTLLRIIEEEQADSKHK